MRWKDVGRTCAAVIAALAVTAGAAAAGTLDHIARDKSIRIAFRDDAPPFSYKAKGTQLAGYMVDLCRAVAKKLAEQLKLPTLNIIYVSVTAADRFEAITQGKADLLCEPTTQTLVTARAG
jgi:ABC-type amino acid transport substrate-binding protein